MSATEDDTGPWLRVTGTPEGLCVAGELTFSTCGVLDERLRELDDSGRDALVVDVSELAFCDSSGLSTLISAYRRAHRRGGTVTLLGVHGVLARLLALTGVGGLFAVERAARSESG